MAIFMSYQALVTLALVACSGVVAQEPFITYNRSIPIGEAGFVKWDTNSFAAPVNLWLQQLTPNAAAEQVPLDYSNTKGFFLWQAGTNLQPGQYFYQLQSVGGNGIIFKSNPLMVVCFECPVESPAATGGTATPTGADGQGGGGVSSSGTSASDGPRLSAGAAAGIGVGGALLVVAIVGLIFFLLRRARKRKQDRHKPFFQSVPSTHHPSMATTSPSPRFPSPYQPPQEVKMGYNDPPPIALGSQHGEQGALSHELDSAAVTSNSQRSAYHAQSEGMTAQRLPSPQFSGIIAPQPQSPPPTLSRSGFQYHRRSHGQVSPPQGSQRSPGSNHDNSSYGFPSHEASPNPEVEGFQFQQQPPPPLHGAGSPESQHRLVPRKTVPTSPNLEGSR